ncbi:MAG: (2Fe-2S)-binding protein [Deltaproteobacteria bacterium]|nr:(2Fe-2S)-binding protein [Deltaproteobacteria bacterium]
MPKITIDDKTYDVAEGKTVLKVCLEQNIPVPYFCYHPRLSIAGNCRMCMVEIEGRPKLEISCNTLVQDGMVVRTTTPKAIEARKSVLEFILINHPLDCPICDQAGECDLQDQYFQFSAVPYRFREEKVHKPKAVPLGPLVMLDDERCIVCTRCVRFCDEVAKTHELGVAERGDHSTIVTFANEGMKNAYSLNTVDICPVGALTNRDFRFNKRVWFLKNTPSICAGCATGCNIWMDHQGDVIYRYRPRDNEAVNQSWMCDEGRLTYKFVNAPDRITSPYAQEAGGGWARLTWDAALKRLNAAFAKVPPAERGIVLSAQCSNEENTAWSRLASEQWKTSLLFGTWRQPSNPTQDNILRHADKNPNTRCLQELKCHREYTGGARLLIVLDTLTPEEATVVEKERPEFVVVLATNWGTDQDAVRWRPIARGLPISGGSCFPWADLVLPLATFAEQAGTFTNAKGMAQRFERAFPPKGEALPAWSIAEKVAGQ